MINILKGCWLRNPSGFGYQTYIGDLSCRIFILKPHHSEDGNVIYIWHLNINGDLYNYHMNEKTSCLDFSSAKLDYEPIINVEPYINYIYDMWTTDIRKIVIDENHFLYPFATEALACETMFKERHNKAINHFYTFEDCKNTRKELNFHPNHKRVRYTLSDSSIDLRYYSLNIDTELRQFAEINRKMFLKLVLNKYITIMVGKPIKSARK